MIHTIKNEGYKMKLKTIIPLSASLLLLCLSTMAAFYEGSALRDDIFEWRWSTPFTMLTAERISHADQVSKLDYLVYAAKFQPFFPAIMLICLISILILASYIGIKNPKTHAYYFSVLACVMASAGLMILSDHVGTKFIYSSILLSGVIISSLLAYQHFTQTLTQSTFKQNET